VGQAREGLPHQGPGAAPGPGRPGGGLPRKAPQDQALSDDLITAQHEGYERLAAAIIADGVTGLRAGRPRCRGRFVGGAAYRDWLRERKSAQELFEEIGGLFTIACESVGIDPEAAREAIARRTGVPLEARERRHGH